MTTKQETKKILNKSHKHAKNHCANHTGKNGCLMTAHGKCVLSFDSDRVAGNVCPYFLKSVLPMDKKLERDYTEQLPDGHKMKPDKEDTLNLHDCLSCGKKFVKNSNRQKYCKDCSRTVKNKQSKNRMKKHRGNSNN